MDRFSYKEPKEEPVRCVGCDEPFEPSDMWDTKCDRCLEKEWIEHIGRMGARAFMKELHFVCESAETGWDKDHDDEKQVRLYYDGLADDQIETAKKMLDAWGVHQYYAIQDRLWVHCEIGKDADDQVTLVPVVRVRSRRLMDNV